MTKHRKNYAKDAEALYLDFAARHQLIIEKVDQEETELQMRLPVQEKLPFELLLGLQNFDELDINFCGFWGTLFPFETAKSDFSEMLDGLINGSTRLVRFYQRGHVVKQHIETFDGQEWIVFYSASKLSIPFWPKHRRIVDLTNEGHEEHNPTKPG